MQIDEIYQKKNNVFYYHKNYGNSSKTCLNIAYAESFCEFKRIITISGSYFNKKENFCLILNLIKKSLILIL